MSATRTLRKALVRLGSSGRQSDGGLVVGRTAAYIEYQPRVRDLHDDGVALKENLPAEQRLIELTGPVLIGNNQKVRNDETVPRCGKSSGFI
jgi:hypothetical protein